MTKTGTEGRECVMARGAKADRQTGKQANRQGRCLIVERRRVGMCLIEIEKRKKKVINALKAWSHFPTRLCYVIHTTAHESVSWPFVIDNNRPINKRKQSMRVSMAYTTRSLEPCSCV